MPRTVLDIWGLSVNTTDKKNLFSRQKINKGNDSKCSKVIHQWNNRAKWIRKVRGTVLSRVVRAGFAGRFLIS